MPSYPTITTTSASQGSSDNLSTKQEKSFLSVKPLIVTKTLVKHKAYSDKL